MPVKPGLEKRFTPREDAFYPSHDAIDFCHPNWEDIALMAEMGFSVFRTSIAWSRHHPNDDELTPNPGAIAFYHAIFEVCRKYNIEPLVTEYDSWRNRKRGDFFAHYTRSYFEAFAGLMKYWLTFNEINILLHSPFSGARRVFEPGENQAQVKYEASHHERVASALVTRIAHEESWRAFARVYPELNTPLNHQTWRATLLPFAAGPAKLNHAHYQAYEQFLFDKKLIKRLTPVEHDAIGSE